LFFESGKQKASRKEKTLCQIQKLQTVQTVPTKHPIAGVPTVPISLPTAAIRHPTAQTEHPTKHPTALQTVPIARTRAQTVLKTADSQK
jgi:hypothetical protein